MEMVKAAVVSLLPIQGTLQVGALNDRTILIRFTLPEDCSTVLDRGSVKIAGAWIRFCRWNPDWKSKTSQSPVVSIWVQLPRLPYHLFDTPSLARIYSPIGRLVALDWATANRTRPEMAKVKLEIDVSLPLIDKLWLETDGGIGFWQKLDFGEVPKFCSLCSRLGHGLLECRNRQNSVEATPVAEVPLSEANAGAPPREAVADRKTALKDARFSQVGINDELGHDPGPAPQAQTQHPAQVTQAQQVSKNAPPVPQVQTPSNANGGIFCPSELNKSQLNCEGINSSTTQAQTEEFPPLSAQQTHTPSQPILEEYNTPQAPNKSAQNNPTPVIQNPTQPHSQSPANPNLIPTQASLASAQIHPRAITTQKIVTFMGTPMAQKQTPLSQINPANQTSINLVPTSSPSTPSSQKICSFNSDFSLTIPSNSILSDAPISPRSEFLNKASQILEGNRFPRKVVDSIKRVLCNEDAKNCEKDICDFWRALIDLYFPADEESLNELKDWFQEFLSDYPKNIADMTCNFLFNEGSIMDEHVPDLHDILLDYVLSPVV